MSTVAYEAPESMIEAERAEHRCRRDLWRYREWFCFQAWRDNSERTFADVI